MKMYLPFVLTILCVTVNAEGFKSEPAAESRKFSYDGAEWLPAQDLSKDEILQKLRNSISQKKLQLQQQSASHTIYEPEYADYAARQSGSAETARDIEAQEKLVFTGVNADSIYSGVLDVNNILIHVGQNLVNFLAGSAVWAVLGALNLPNARRRRSGSASARSLESEGGLLDNFSSSDFSWLLRKIADTSDMIATLHEEL